MALDIRDNGDVCIYQGDSGEIVVSGLNTDKDYTVYFTVKDEKRKTIGSELSVNSNYKPSVKFILTSGFTDLLKVADDEDYANYYYGIKVCDGNGVEDTMFVFDSGYGEKNRIIVFPKKVEGIV